MRWFLITVALLATCAAGIAWVYLRDWERPRVVRSEPDRAALAARNARNALRSLAGGPRCRSCRLVVEHNDERTWRVRVAGARRARCFSVDLAAFRMDPKTGLRGVVPTACLRPAAGLR